MKKIKVIHVINNLEIGGAEKVLALLLENLRTHPNVESKVVSLEGHGPLEGDISRLGVEVKNFHFNLFTPLLRRIDPYFRFSLYFYFVKEKPDIIHGHLIRGEDFAKVLGGLLGIPVITTLHDVMIRPGRKQKFLNRFLTKAIAVSPVVASHLEQVYQIPKDKVIIIPDAIDTTVFAGSKKVFDSANPVFIYIGRLFKTKGIEFAIEGLAMVQKEIPGLKFLIYGKKVFQDDFDKWQSLIKRNKWDFVEFMGPTNDVPAALGKGDIFVLPSKSEGFSMAVLEAAAASKPIIATRTGSITEMLKEGETGYFVEYGDSEQIYQSAKKIITKGVEQMGRESRELVKDKFNIEKVAEMYYNLYSSIVKGEND